MAGIYIHFPFCRSKCGYCNFFSLASVKWRENLVDVICSEIRLRKTENMEEVSSVYFGGGTPSLMNSLEISKILNVIRNAFSVSNGAEITLEVNPEDVTADNMQGWAEVGINRISLGIQSFDDVLLKHLGRRHDARASQEALQMALDVFPNVSADLIFGIPAQTASSLLADLDVLLKHKVPHISAYALTVEENTAMHWMIRHGKMLPPDDAQTVEHFYLLHDTLINAGFEHYEISNYCLPDFSSRHNSAYWKGVPYLGFGPSAHSYNGNERYWNISEVATYIDGLKRGIIPSERESLSPEQKVNEYIMTSLRTSEGIHLPVLEAMSPQAYPSFLMIAQRFLASGDLYEEEAYLRLSRSGLVFADRITAELFLP